MIRVGTKKSEKTLYSYADVVVDAEGFADVTNYLPLEYDLCDLMTDQGTKAGWYSYGSWDGLRLNGTEKVLAWRKKPME